MGSAIAQIICCSPVVSHAFCLICLDGRLGLEQHLIKAVEQSKQANMPVVVTIVVYNLPSRDCAALASNGELGLDGLPAYESEWVFHVLTNTAASSSTTNTILAVAFASHHMAWHCIALHHITSNQITLQWCFALHIAMYCTFTFGSNMQYIDRDQFERVHHNNEFTLLVHYR
jgi:Glycosyl hydrolases family 6